MESIRRMRLAIWKNRSAYLFILPSFVFFAVFTLLPVIRGILLSFMQYRVPPAVSTYAGLQNYTEAFSSAIWYRAIGNTLYYTVYVVFGSIAVALGVAVMIFRLPNRQQGFFKCLFYLPGVTSGIIVASVWKWIFHPMYGLLNYLIGLLGFSPVSWLGTPATAMPSIIFMDISKGDGAAVLLILAALNSIPPTVFEAAQCDGARRSQIFLRVTLPLLKPILLYLIVMGTISALQMFVPVFMLTKGGPEMSTISVAYEIYQNAFMRMMRFDLAAAQGVVLFAATMVISVLYFKLFKDDVSY